MKIFITIILAGILGWFIYTNFGSDDTKEKSQSELALSSKIANTDKGVQSDVKMIVKAANPTSLKDLDNKVSLEALEIAKLMKPPSNAEMESMWQYSYGCGNLKDDNPDACEFKTLFNAESLEEAQWMKRHGFPHRGMIEQLRDQNNHDKIVELANNNYKPAVALAALVNEGFQNHDSAVRWAARYGTLSDPTEIYAHRLMGQISASEDPLSQYVLQHYLIAQYLGDYEASFLVEEYWTGSDRFNDQQVSIARDFILNHIGPPFDQQPYDPRPKPDGGG